MPLTAEVLLCCGALLPSSLAAAIGTANGVAAEDYGVDNSLHAIGEDFRIDNAVYASDRKEPTSRSVTIFHKGVVYDCMTTPAETVVFDKTAKRFVLLNMADHTRAELTTDDVTTFLDRFESRLRSMIAKTPNALLEFMADPKFEERYDGPTGELTLASPLVNYKLLLSSGQSKSMVEQYRDFSDWYARLNTLLTPAALPPFGRLAVNKAVAKRKAIASQVTLAIASAKSGRRRTIRSTHEIVRRLTRRPISIGWRKSARPSAISSRSRSTSIERARRSRWKAEGGRRRADSEPLAFDLEPWILDLEPLPARGSRWAYRAT